MRISFDVLFKQHMACHLYHNQYFGKYCILINPKSAKKKMHLKMSSAEVVCCK